MSDITKELWDKIADLEKRNQELDKANQDLETLLSRAQAHWREMNGRLQAMELRLAKVEKRDPNGYSVARHLKRRTVYTVLGEAEFQSSKDYDIFMREGFKI